MNGDNHTIENKIHDLEKRFAVLEERITNHVQSTKDALNVALSAMEKRLEGMNEFRQTLSDQTKTFVTFDMYESKHEQLVLDIKELREWRANQQGKASQTSLIITLIISVTGVLLSIVDIIIKR